MKFFGKRPPLPLAGQAPCVAFIEVLCEPPFQGKGGSHNTSIKAIVWPAPIRLGFACININSNHYSINCFLENTLDRDTRCSTQSLGDFNIAFYCFIPERVVGSCIPQLSVLQNSCAIVVQKK